MASASTEVPHQYLSDTDSFVGQDMLYYIAMYLPPARRFQLCAVSKLFNAYFRRSHYPFQFFVNNDVNMFVTQCAVFDSKQYIFGKEENRHFLTYLKYILIFWKEFRSLQSPYMDDISQLIDSVPLIISRQNAHFPNDTYVEWLSAYFRYSSQLVANIHIEDCDENAILALSNAICANQQHNAFGNLECLSIGYAKQIREQTVKVLLDSIGQHCGELRSLHLFAKYSNRSLTMNKQTVAKLISDFYAKYHHAVHLNNIEIFWTAIYFMDDSVQHRLRQIFSAHHTPINYDTHGLHINIVGTRLELKYQKHVQDGNKIQCRTRQRHGDRFQCPCCDYYSLDERGYYEICHICFWEDDYLDVDSLDEVSGPNHVSLRQGRANFIRHKACDQKMIKTAKETQANDDYMQKTKCEKREIPLMVQVEFH